MNGVTGLKPTWGRVSRHGSFVLSASLDHLGPMTRCAADAAAMLAAIAGLDDKDPTTLPAPVPDYVGGLEAGVFGARGLRIGIDPTFNSVDVEPLVARLIAEAGGVFAALGAEIVEISFPDATAVRTAWAPFCAAETALVHKDTYPSRKSDTAARWRPSSTSASPPLPSPWPMLQLSATGSRASWPASSPPSITC